MKKFSGLFTILFSAIFWVLISLTGVLTKFEYRLYDILIAAKNHPQESPELLFVEIDNFAIDTVGPWPWKRDIYANALLRMKELNASCAVFDVEFLSPSNFAKCDDYFAKSVQFFGNTWLTINTSELNIEFSPAEIDYAKDRFLISSTGKNKTILEGNRKSRYEQQFNSLHGYNKIDWDNPNSTNNIANSLAEGFSPAHNLFISKAKGAGFTNVIIDTDGSRRRVELLAYQKDKDKSVGQLVFAPLLSILQPQEIIKDKKSLTLKKANVKGKVQDIKIPLDEYGRMLINWTKTPFQNSYRHESFMFLHQLDMAENNINLVLKELLLNFDELESAKNNSTVEFIKTVEDLYFEYSEILDFKNYLLQTCEGYDNDSNAINGGIDFAMQQNYFDLRKNYFESIEQYAKSDSANAACNLIQEKLFELRDSLGEEMYQHFATTFAELYDILEHEVLFYNSLFSEKQEVYKDAFCIIGQTASSTTDLGTTPFERAFPNVGTHANVYNTIVNNSFIKPVNAFWAILLTIIISIALQECTKNKKPFFQNLAGIGIICITIIIPIIAIRFAGVYIPSLTPILIAITSFLVISMLRFIVSEKDKKFLQTTFGAYVAPAVVDQIVKHPELASLGGKSEHLTALFSDVKTFSGFTEVINNEAGEEKGAEKLVEILNEYLGVLSDAIMQSNGTIDKYVGDEIVSFFGAPIPAKNNAYDACVAAIRMLQAEKEFNEKNKDRLPINPKTGEPFYLRSRVGLNTGNMVVGNMGTEKKLNYTIMGNNVNLASRLEGTNKVYGSWIMCSESTWNMANQDEYEGLLVARKFDNVRVVNVKKPVGIYNILGLKDELSQEQIDSCNMFNQGIELYLKGSDTPDVPKSISELKKAYTFFKNADKIYPEDLSSKVFMARCADYIKNGVPKMWDGVYTMTSK